MIDERTEQLITRRLDGELAEGESLELDKQLIRSPQARRAFEASQRIDTLAVETLHRILDDRATLDDRAAKATEAASLSPPLNKGGLRGGRGLKGRRARWLLDGAIGAAAAVLLIILLSRSNSPQRPRIQPRPGIELAGPLAPAALPAPYLAADPPALTQVIAGPRRQQERIDQDVIGVVDPETQSVYLLELQTARNRISSVRANY